MFINPAGGNGAHILGIDAALRVNELRISERLLPYDIVVPVISQGQAAILHDEYGQQPGAESIVVDDVSAEILRPLLESQGDFARHIGVIARQHAAVQRDLNNRFGTNAAPTTMHRLLSGEAVTIDPENIAAVFNAGGRAAIEAPGKNIFMFPTLLSELIAATRSEAGTFSFSEADMEQARLTMRRVEGINDLVFEPLINTLSHRHLGPGPASVDSVFEQLLAQPKELDGNAKSRIHTPPMKAVLPTEYLPEVTEEGVFAMASGTDQALEATILAAKKAGLTVYTNPWTPTEVRDVERISPRALRDPRILALFGRAGWGSGWLALNRGDTGLPWFVAPYHPGDDPEMWHNNRTVESTGIGEVVHPEQFSASQLREKIDSYSRRIAELGDLTEQEFGTRHGIDFMAHKIVKHLLGSA